MIYVAAVCLLTLLGVAYVRLYDVVKTHQPEALPRFDVIRFVAIYMAMYVVMMVITLSLRH